MDPRTFDRWTAAVAHQRSRRAAVRVLAGGLLGGLLSPRPARAALQADRDGDGLFDDDETNVYGTNPDVFDTDGDGSGDGEEIYFGTDPLSAGGPVARADSDGDGLYDADETAIYGTNPNVFDTDGDGVGDGEEVNLGSNPLTPADGANPGAQTCAPEGTPCTSPAGCCSGVCDFLVGGGTCGSCLGQYCDAANLCCPGVECINSRCQGCLHRGVVCSPGATPCCASECTNGVCLSGSGGRCVYDADCQACYSGGNCANACLNGVCQV
jgi:hypothetical protein